MQGLRGGIDSLGEHQGRLELTWTNKHLRLLAHEDGSYEWVSPSDYRVAEVRLLDDVTTVGDVSPDRAKDNHQRVASVRSMSPDRQRDKARRSDDASGGRKGIRDAGISTRAQVAR